MEIKKGKGRGYFFIDTLVLGGIKRKDESRTSLWNKLDKAIDWKEASWHI